MAMTERELANVWTRFGALAIDGLFLVPIYICVYLPVYYRKTYPDKMSHEQAMWIIIPLFIVAIAFFLWNNIYLMGTTGQSLGRRFTRIIVLSKDGKPIGIGRALLRETLGRWISTLFCYAGYITGFWDDKFQMWHDKMAACFVYYTEAGEEENGAS